MIFCKSEKGAERVLKSTTKYLEDKMKLKVNREKTCVADASKIKYLGFGFYYRKGAARIAVHQKSKDKLWNKLRKLLSKSAGDVSNVELRQRLERVVRGWVNYFRIADMKSFLSKTDQWMRRKIRARYWKQWKKVKTKYKALRKLGLREELAIKYANSRKGYWRIAKSHVLDMTLTVDFLRRIGYTFFSDYYSRVIGH